MYVTHDLDQSEEAGRALIAMDRAWAPSYAELAEAYLFFKRPAQAAAFYDRAVQCGPPHYGYHLQRAARAYQQAGQNEAALDRYLALTQLVPRNESVLTAGLDLARTTAPDSRSRFESLLEALTK